MMLLQSVGNRALFAAVLLLQFAAVTVLAQSLSLSDPVPQPSTSPSPIGQPELEFFAPSNVSSCSPMSISWLWSNVENADLTTLTITITNSGVRQDPPVSSSTTPDPLLDLRALRPRQSPGTITQTVTTSVFISDKSFVWTYVQILESGWYVLQAYPTVPSPTLNIFSQSSRFFVNVQDVSCLAVSSDSSSANSTPTHTSTSASETSAYPPHGGPHPQEGGGGGGLSKGGIAGAVVGVLVGIGLLIGAFFFCIRRRPGAGSNKYPVGFSGKKSSSSSSSSDMPKGKWGGLKSIDSGRGQLPPTSTTTSTTSPSAAPTNTLGSAFAFTAARRNRHDSLSRVHEEDEYSLDEEKMVGPRGGSGADVTVLPVQRSGSSSATTSASGHAPGGGRMRSASLRASNQSLADYNPYAATFAAATTGATTPENPRASRTMSVALPSLNSSNRGSLDGPLVPAHSHPALPPQHARTPSANALGRPARKPVPTYHQDPPIELLANSSNNASLTNLGGPGPVTPYGSAQTTSSFLTDRGPKQSLGSRSYGSTLGLPSDLPGEGDGPVHYLIPDLPPPQKD